MFWKKGFIVENLNVVVMLRKIVMLLSCGVGVVWMLCFWMLG